MSQGAALILALGLIALGIAIDNGLTNIARAVDRATIEWKRRYP